MNKISLKISNKCNLKCKFCYEFFDRFHFNGEMTLKTLYSFLDKISEQHDKFFISLTGGEPLLHSKVIDFIEILYQFDFVEKPIQVMTNGIGSRVNENIYKIMKKYKTYHAPARLMNVVKSSQTSKYDILIWASKRDSKIEKVIHRPTTIAPIDDERFKNFSDEYFREGCPMQWRCGLCFDYNGKFYVCPKASAIDKIFNFNIGTSNYPTKYQLNKQKEIFCRLCTEFYNKEDIPNNIKDSKIWANRLKEIENESTSNLSNT